MFYLKFLIFVSVFYLYSSEPYFDREVMDKYVKDGFKTKRLSANLTTKADIDEFWMNFLDKEDMYYYDQIDQWPRNKNEVLEYLKKQDNPNFFYFCIKLNRKGKPPKPIGQLNFKFISKGVLTLSYWIAKEHRRRGYLKEIGFKFIEEVFFKLNDVTVLEIYIDDFNIASKSFAKSLFKYIKERHKGCRDEIFTVREGSDLIVYCHLYKPNN